MNRSVTSAPHFAVDVIAIFVLETADRVFVIHASDAALDFLKCVMTAFVDAAGLAGNGTAGLTG